MRLAGRTPAQLARGAGRHARARALAVAWKARSTRRRLEAARRFRHIRRGRRTACWCGGELGPFPHHASYRVCRTCGSYVNVRPPLAEDLAELYSLDLYWKRRQALKGFPTIEDRAELYRRDGRLDAWLALVADHAPEPGLAIEVGCAPGVLLEELAGRGWKTVGVEISADAAAWLRDRLGLDVRAGSFPGVELPPCDLFLAFDVLEHSPEPDAFLREAARLLRPGGVAIVQTAVDRHDHDPPFGHRFDIFDDLEHLFLFTDRALELLAERAGLEVVDLSRSLWIAGELAVLRRPAET